MQVVGIDLGTTNLRVSTWDPESGQLPQPLTIGQGDAYTMPTVVAFRRQPGGEVETIVGEDADNLEDNSNQVVVRNVKRFALAHDPFVRWHLEVRETGWPSWWNRDSRCIQIWGQEFPVKDLLSLMLQEAFRRAELEPGFEWRAGCPVHAGLTYRSELAQVITDLGGAGKGEVSRIVEEPLLLLALAHELGALKPDTDKPVSSYMVYDLGGGSFDCALCQVGARQMIIYGADGNPVIGGSDIDHLLAGYLEHTGNPNLLRLAKEVVGPSTPQNLPGGKTLSWEDYKRAVKEGQFITKTLSAMRDAYIGAKYIWRRNWDDVPPEVIENALKELEAAPNEESYLREHFEWLWERTDVPSGEVIQRNPETRDVKFVWQLNWADMAGDIDGIILCGGPTKSPVFLAEIQNRFGDTRVIPTAELIPPEIPDPELTAISAGACYAYSGEYSPLYVNRLPVRITLEDLQTGEKVHYEPYSPLAPSPRQPFGNFKSRDSLREEPDDPHSDTRYELTVTTPEGVLLKTTNPDNEEAERQPVGKEYRDTEENPSINTRLVNHKLRLVIDRLGRVGVEQEADQSVAKEYKVITSHSWQTEEQKRAIRQTQLLDKFFKKLEKARTHQALARNPWGWQEHAG